MFFFVINLITKRINIIAISTFQIFFQFFPNIDIINTEVIFFVLSHIMEYYSIKNYNIIISWIYKSFDRMHLKTSFDQIINVRSDIQVFKRGKSATWSLFIVGLSQEGRTCISDLFPKAEGKFILVMWGRQGTKKKNNKRVPSRWLLLRTPAVSLNNAVLEQSWKLLYDVDGLYRLLFTTWRGIFSHYFSTLHSLYLDLRHCSTCLPNVI